MWFGLSLILVGVLFLLENIGVLSGDLWAIIWPSVIIIFGLSILSRRNRCCEPKVKIKKEQ